MNRLQVRWAAREVPLEPVGAVAVGPSARQLGIRCAGRVGVVAQDVLVVFGEDLPWVDGVRYIGELIPQLLWVDTCLEPDLPKSVLEQWIRQSSLGPTVWVPGVIRVDVGARARFDAERLAAWCER